MKLVGKEEFDNAPLTVQDPVKDVLSSDKSLDLIIGKLDNPVELQKEVVGQVYLSLQERMRRELADSGTLSESTRRWIELYNSMCDSLHKNLFGDKSVQLHLHKISHSQIAAHIRKNANVVDVRDDNVPNE